jgi:hypothetical protein
MKKITVMNVMRESIESADGEHFQAFIIMIFGQTNFYRPPCNFFHASPLRMRKCHVGRDIKVSEP